MALDPQITTLVSLQVAAAVGFTGVLCCLYPITEPRFLGGLPAGGENLIDASVGIRKAASTIRIGIPVVPPIRSWRSGCTALVRKVVSRRLSLLLERSTGRDQTPCRG
jgi:hypothetical protein